MYYHISTIQVITIAQGDCVNSTTSRLSVLKDLAAVSTEKQKLFILAAGNCKKDAHKIVRGYFAGELFKKRNRRPRRICRIVGFQSQLVRCIITGIGYLRYYVVLSDRCRLLMAYRWTFLIKGRQAININAMYFLTLMDGTLLDDTCNVII